MLLTREREGRDLTTELFKLTDPLLSHIHTIDTTLPGIEKRGYYSSKTVPPRQNKWIRAKKPEHTAKYSTLQNIPVYALHTRKTTLTCPRSLIAGPIITLPSPLNMTRPRVMTSHNP